MGKSVKKTTAGAARAVVRAGGDDARAASGAKKLAGKKPGARKLEMEKPESKKADTKKSVAKKLGAKKVSLKKQVRDSAPPLPSAPPMAVGASSAVLDRLWAVVDQRRDADPAISHSARLLSRGTAKVAQKFGEEAVECLIEAVGRNRDALIAESADVLYHLIVMWVDAGVRADDVWRELQRREGVSGVAEKASRARSLPLEMGLGTTKIP